MPDWPELGWYAKRAAAKRSARGGSTGEVDPRKLLKRLGLDPARYVARITFSTALRPEWQPWPCVRLSAPYMPLGRYALVMPHWTLAVVETLNAQETDRLDAEVLAEALYHDPNRGRIANVCRLGGRVAVEPVLHAVLAEWALRTRPRSGTALTP